MSGTTMKMVRGLTVLAALALAACATTRPSEPPTTQALLESMGRAPQATLQSCGALNMALVCQSTGMRATGARAIEGRCSCADRNELIASPTFR
jgi:hypothetical protein